MDIVNRIKTFMNANGIGSTQFADACRIPRPTMSQILSGRNKKISDEVISKIHDAYPQLSVLWLLFGEGEMTTVARAFSAAAETSHADRSAYGVDAAHSSPYVTGTTPPVDVSDDSDDAMGLFGSDALIFDDGETMREVVVPSDANQSQSGAATVSNAGGAPTVQIPADGSKSIINIMVFYSDNSFQSFVPR